LSGNKQILTHQREPGNIDKHTGSSSNALLFMGIYFNNSVHFFYNVLKIKDGANDEVFAKEKSSDIKRQ
jgi:hypothetical protein